MGFFSFSLSRFLFLVFFTSFSLILGIFAEMYDEGRFLIEGCSIAGIREMRG